MRKNIFLLVLTWMNVLCHADQEFSPVTPGVWRGTVGSREVRVCLDSFESSYYDLEKLNGIKLIGKDKSNALLEFQEGSENKTTATWKLKLVDDSHLTGQRTAIADNQVVPVSLSLEVANSENGFCHSASLEQDETSPGFMYNKPRIKFSEQEIAPYSDRFDKIKARCVPGGCAELFATENSQEQIQTFVTHWLNSQAATYYQCELNRDRGYPHSSNLVVKFKSPHWLIMQEHYMDSWCMGGRGGAVEYVFDLETGSQVEGFSDWFNQDPENKEVSVSDQERFVYGIPEELGLIVKAIHIGNASGNGFFYGEDNDLCFKEYLAVTVYPNAHGIEFDISGMCGEFIYMPYDKVMPYLSAKGKDNVAELLQQAREGKVTSAGISRDPKPNNAEPQPLSYAGIWRGTLGTQKITACFDSGKASYLYDRYKTGIPLTLFDSKAERPVWLEGEMGKLSGAWVFHKIEAGHLQGSWTNGPQVLPLELTLDAANTAPLNCAATAFAKSYQSGK